MLKIAITLGSCFLGSLLQSMCGFGNGPINMAILPHVMSYGDAVTLTTLMGLAICSTLTLRYFKHINWKLAIPFTASSILLTAVSVEISLGVAKQFMMQFLSLMLVALSLYNIFCNGKIRVKPTVLNGIICGAISGAFIGFFSSGGPPAALFMLAATKTNEEYIGTMNTSFSLSAVSSLIMRSVNGTISAYLIYTWFLALFAIIAGFIVGSKIFRNLNSKRLSIAANIYILISGVIMFFS